MKSSILAMVLAVIAFPVLAGDDGSRFTSFLGLRLNVGTLNEVQARLGKTRLIESTDTEDYEARMCYLGSNGVVSFVSAVPRLELSGFEVREAVTATAEGCRELHGRQADQAKELAGLHLGMSKAEFVSLLGGPVQWEGNTGQRQFDSEQKMTGSERGLFKDSPELLMRGTFNVSVTVTGTFLEDHLVGFRVWKIVSV